MPRARRPRALLLPCPLTPSRYMPLPVRVSRPDLVLVIIPACATPRPAPPSARLYLPQVVDRWTLPAPTLPCLRVYCCLGSCLPAPTCSLPITLPAGGTFVRCCLPYPTAPCPNACCHLTPTALPQRLTALDCPVHLLRYCRALPPCPAWFPCRLRTRCGSARPHPRLAAACRRALPPAYYIYRGRSLFFAVDCSVLPADCRWWTGRSAACHAG